MKRNILTVTFFRVLIIAFICPWITDARGEGPERKFAGTWSGTLSAMGSRIPLVMNVSFTNADSMIVTFDSPDQGARDIPTSMVLVKDDSISVTSKTIAGNFSGKINADATSISGVWKQSGFSFPLLLVRQGEKIAINRPQEPKPPFPYRVTEVTFPNRADGFELAGTLTMPEKEGHYPGVVLITGSGPQNRDEELLGHKPFLVLADWLTRHGMAVLRYDDRGVAKSKGDFATSTTLDFASDAEAALNFLKGRQEIDTTDIGLIGHSEGGLVAAIVTARRNDVAFIVLMAGPGLTGEQILLMQAALISRAEGADEQTIRSNEKLSRDMYTVLRKNSDNEKAGKKLRGLMADFDKKHVNDTSYHPLQETEIALQVKTLTSPWFRCFLTLDPEEYLSKVKCPLLAVNGSLDLQVPPRENQQAIEKALIFGGNSRYEITELPGLNHLFQTATTGSPTEYAKIEETISPSALETIWNWLQKTVIK